MRPMTYALHQQKNTYHLWPTLLQELAPCAPCAAQDAKRKDGPAAKGGPSQKKGKLGGVGGGKKK